MKKSKWLAMAGLLAAGAFFLAACGSSTGSNSAKTYSYVYQTDPDTLDYVNSNRASTSDVIANLVDGLLENDQYGNLIPSLAEDWTVSKDGLTYTYKLREGAKWYTADGEEYADVKAQDFVTGLKHAADEKSEALPIVQTSIKGLDDYVKGASNDFSSVGVKAVDDYTVEYTLNQPESYWNSKTTMGILFPINEDFLEKEGKEFGAVKPSGILYNGPYILKSYTSKSVIEYSKNQNYWDKDKVKIEDVKLTYYDSQDIESLARGFENGSYTYARVYPNSSNFSKVREKLGKNIIFGDQRATTFAYTFNLDRLTYEHTAKTSDAQRQATKQAFLNKDFRQALNFAINREVYSAQVNGEEGATKNLRNTFVPPGFVQIGDKEFGRAVEEKLAAYGPEWQGVKLDDAQDGLYNPDKAKAEFAKAKEALQAQGVEFPIHIDMPVAETDTLTLKQTQSLKQSVESVLGADNVQIDIQQMSEQEVNNITYFAQTAAQQDWDLNLAGWSPDYQDPSSYFDIMNSKTGESFNKYFGIDPGTSNPAIQQAGLEELDALSEDANAEKQDLKARYDKYAQAQAWLTDSSLMIPILSLGGGAGVTRLVPYTDSFAWTGEKFGGSYFKYKQIQQEPVTAEEYQKARKKWLKEKEESNAKAQEELKEHIK